MKKLIALLITTLLALTFVTTALADNGLEAVKLQVNNNTYESTLWSLKGTTPTAIHVAAGEKFDIVLQNNIKFYDVEVFGRLNNGSTYYYRGNDKFQATEEVTWKVPENMEGSFLFRIWYSFECEKASKEYMPQWDEVAFLMSAY